MQMMLPAADYEMLVIVRCSHPFHVNEWTQNCKQGFCWRPTLKVKRCSGFSLHTSYNDRDLFSMYITYYHGDGAYLGQVSSKANDPALLSCFRSSGP